MKMMHAVFIAGMIYLLTGAWNHVSLIMERDTIGSTSYDNGITCYTTQNAIYCARLVDK